MGLYPTRLSYETGINRNLIQEKGMRIFFERQKYLIDYTLTTLLRRKTRNLGLLLVYTLLVFLFSAVLLISEGLRREAVLLLQDAPEVIVQKLVAGRHDLLPADWLGSLQRIRGVSSVQGRLWGYYYDPIIKANYTLMAAPNRGLAADEILIGATLARTRQIGTGDYFSLRTATGQPLPLKITGVLDSASELLSADLVLLSNAGYQQLFQLPPDVFTDAVLTVRNPREAPTVARKIALALPGSRPILRTEILRTYDAIFNWREGIIFAALGGSLLAFIILAWDKAAGLSAEEKREIGILKAIGWETSDILIMKLWEGTLLSLTAFLAGYVLAYWQTFHGGTQLFTPVLKGWAVLYPDFQLTPVINPQQVLVLLAITVLPYIAAILIPSWRAAISDPDAIMRGSI